jgi:uncharacterized protein YbjT (DUF2867 family)
LGATNHGNGGGNMILITGAAGYVGNEVVKRARAEGFDVRAVVRNPESKSARRLRDELGVELFHGNVLNADSLKGSMNGVKAVIHLVGIITEVKEQTFERVHVEGTRNVVEAAKKGGVKRYLHMSALGTRENAVSRYHKTKWEAEEIVRGSGLSWTIFRPSIIYGPGDAFVNLFAKIAKWSPFVPVMGNGQGKLQPIPVEDVATCFVKALKNDNTIGKIYELCGPEPLTFNQVLDTILRVTGKKRLKLHVPMPIARIQAALLEMICEAPPLNRDQLIMLGEDNVGNPKPAVEEFQLTPVSFEQGIARYLRK